MGKKVQRRVYLLNFADGSDLDGAHIKVGSLSYGEMKSLRIDPEDPEAEEKSVAKMDLVASRLKEWDLEEEDGTPIPTTLEGLESLELATIVQIINAWVEAHSVVAPPLFEGSPSGATSLEASIPMTPIDSSQSLAS